MMLWFRIFFTILYISMIDLMGDIKFEKVEIHEKAITGIGSVVLYLFILIFGSFIMYKYVSVAFWHWITYWIWR